MKKLRKLRVMGIAVVVFAIVLMVLVPNLVSSVPVSDSGLYLIAGYSLSGIILALGATAVFLG